MHLLEISPIHFEVRIFSHTRTILLPEKDKNPNFAQSFIYDPSESINYRKSICDVEFDELLEILEDLIREYNIFAKSFEMVGNGLRKNNNINDLNLVLSLKPGFDKNH